MKRTDAIQALRERFANTDGTVLPPGLSIISQEEAAALGVFEEQDDGWVYWPHEYSPVCADALVDVKRGNHIGTAMIAGEDVCWKYVNYYRPHRED